MYNCQTLFTVYRSTKMLDIFKNFKFCIIMILEVVIRWLLDIKLKTIQSSGLLR